METTPQWPKLELRIFWTQYQILNKKPPDNDNDQDTLHIGVTEQDTMLHQDDIRVPNITSFDTDNAEYLAFPTVFCGQARPTKCKIKVHYSDICKWELHSVDSYY